MLAEEANGTAYETLLYGILKERRIRATFAKLLSLIGPKIAGEPRMDYGSSYIRPYENRRLFSLYNKPK